MVRSRRQKKTAKRGRAFSNKGPKPHSGDLLSQQLQDDNYMKDGRFELFIIVILLVFGIYQSALYFGHQVVPNSDFPSFVGVARTVLRFEMPANFKRLPGLGILQIGLSKFISGPHPVLTAGWMLNAIVHPLSIVLLYLIGKRLLGRSALGFVLLIAVNPWTIKQLAQPMAETTLMFFTLLTFYLIFRRSYWCYLLAFIATMIRYDAVVLIIAAFIIDMITRKTKKERLTVLLLAFLATLPLALWMLGTYTHWESSSSGHYIKHFTSKKHVGTGYLGLIWEATFQPLLQLPAWIKAIFVKVPTASQIADIKSANDLLYGLSRIAVVIGVLAAVVFGSFKKKWDVVALLIFSALTVSVHTRRSVSTQRYTFPLIWITFLLCCYGWRNIFRLINHKEKIPRPVIIGFQSISSIIVIVWFIMLLPLLSKAAPHSTRSVSLPFVTIGAVILLFMAWGFIYQRRYIVRFAALSFLICLMVVSNHFTLARIVGNGDTDAEFKKLADWYVQNAQPDEKMVTSMPNVVRLFAPKHSKNFIPTSRIKGDDSSGFVQGCYKRNVAYVAWDSRIGLAPNNSYYKKWRISRIAMLGKPQSIGPYGFITQLKQNDRRYINIFKLRTNPPRQ